MGEIERLTEIIVKATEHEGFSFIEVLPPEVSYYKWADCIEFVRFLDKEQETKEEVLIVARKSHKFTLGIFYQVNKQLYHKGLYGDRHPIDNRLSRDERIEKIRGFIESK